MAESLGKVEQAELVAGIGYIDKMVGCRPVFFEVLAAAYIQATINLPRVSRDDLAIKLAGGLNGQMSFTRSCWPEQNEEIHLRECSQKRQRMLISIQELIYNRIDDL